jgi:peptidoglycan/xylan/chitin deacetylase (PgdA/CDA1 family)
LFAYPYGEYDDAAKTVAAAADLAGAFTTKPGLVEPGADPYELPRIEIYRRDVGPKFVWKVATGRRTSAIGRRTRG